MNMKKLYITTLAAALAVGFAGCNSFLDELPDNRTELDKGNVSKILLSAYPSSAICEMAEMSSDNTDQYPDNFSEYNRLQSDLYKWEPVPSATRTRLLPCGNLATLP